MSASVASAAVDEKRGLTELCPTGGVAGALVTLTDPACAARGLLPGAMPARVRRPLPCVAVPLDDRCERWATSYSAPGTPSYWQADVPVGIEVAPDGGAVYMLDAVDIDSALRAYLVAIDPASGEIRWAVREKVATHTFPLAMDLSPDGSTIFIVAEAYVAGGPVGSRFLVAAFDAATGEERWARLHGGPTAFGMATRVVATADAVVAAGWLFDGTSNDTLLVALDPATGKLQWEGRYGDSTGDRRFIPRGLALAPDGARAFVLGAPRYDEGTSGYTYAVLGFDADGPDAGTLRWRARHDPPAGDDVPTAMTATSEHVYVTGASRNPANAYAWAATTIAIEADSGNLRWEHRFDGGFPTHYSAGLDVLADPARDRVFVTGITSAHQEQRLQDPVTISYEGATGAVRWVDREGFGTYTAEMGIRLGLSPDGGRLYAAGQSGPIWWVWPSFAFPGSNVTTTAFDAATGTRAWSARYAHTVDTTAASADIALPLAVAVDHTTGRLYEAAFLQTDVMVAGATTGLTEDLADALVLAYDA